MQKKITGFLREIEKRNSHEPEFMQAVKEVAEDLIPYIIKQDIYAGNTYYLLSTDGNLWWKEAEEIANNLGGHLVHINNERENNWILNTFKESAISYAIENDLPSQSNISLWIYFIIFHYITWYYLYK